MSALDFSTTKNNSEAAIFITESKAIGVANMTWHLIRGAVGFRVRPRVQTNRDRSTSVGWIIEYIDGSACAIGFAAD